MKKKEMFKHLKEEVEKSIEKETEIVSYFLIAEYKNGNNFSRDIIHNTEHSHYSLMGMAGEAIRYFNRVFDEA